MNAVASGGAGAAGKVRGSLLRLWKEVYERPSLLWMPTEDAGANMALAALRWLFREHGPPLVLKADNGVFRAKACQSYVRRQQRVVPSWDRLDEDANPPRVRAARLPGEWTCDDLEEARLQANELARPRGCICHADSTWRKQL